MSDAPRWTIEAADIEYETAAGKPEIEDSGALALMLLNGVLFLNSHWWEKAWPEDARNAISVNVNCSDIFAWACAEAETLPHDQIEPLYRMWRKDPTWGAAIWCIQRRKEMPQRPVADRIRKAGIWDLDSMGLAENSYDAACREAAAERRAAASAA